MIVGMFLTVIPIVGMIVDGFIPLMDVRVRVAMPMDMGVYQIAVPVFVIVNVGMFMGMLQADGVFYHQNSCNNHDGESHIELDAGTLVQQQDTEDDTQEGSDGVIGTGLGSTQILLGFDVEVDAEAIGHKTQQKNSNHPENAGNLLSDHHRDHQTAETGEGTLDGGDLNGGLGAKHPGAVVFQTPAAGSTENQQGTHVELEAAFPLKTQRNAGGGNQNNCQSEPFGQSLPENKEGDHGGCHDFKIVQQGSVGRVRPFQTQHQQNGCGNVQDDHADGIGQLVSGQGIAFFLFTADQTVKKQAQTGTEIQESRHHGGFNLF